MRVVLGPKRSKKQQWVPDPRRLRVGVIAVMVLLGALVAYAIAQVAT